MLTEEPKRCRIRTGYKTKSFWAFYDNTDTYEIYKDLDQTQWVASLHLPTKKILYYNMKTTTAPNLKKYKLIIDSEIYTDFKLIRVSWTY